MAIVWSPKRDTWAETKWMRWGKKGFVKHFLISREAPKEELAVMRRGIK